MKKEVFVTYSWDSEEHKDKVISFCNFLRKEGFDATMDRKISQEQTAPDFIKMMHQAMTDYKKVIVVLSEKYKEKADNFSGGVGLEYNLIIKDIESNPKKYLLVSFDGISDMILPMAFKGREIIDISTPEKRQTLFAKLQDKVEIEFSPVAPNKPHITKKEIPNFNEIQNKNIELIDVQSKPESWTAASNILLNVPYKIYIIVQNNSNKLIDGFKINLTIPEILTIENSKILQNRVDLSSFNSDQKRTSKTVYEEKLYMSEKSEKIEIAYLNIRKENIELALSSSLNIKLYTELGSVEYEKPIKDMLVYPIQNSLFGMYMKNSGNHNGILNINHF